MSSIRGIVKDIIIVATCVAVIWIGLTAYFGAQNPFYVVSSGSMYPELSMHDIIVISGQEQLEVVGIRDNIVLDRPKVHDKVIIHGVVAYVDDVPLTLRTRVDNNQNSIVGTDYPITEEEYKGTVIHVIPQVGYITKMLQPPINYIIIAVIIGIMIIRQISKNKKVLTEQMKTESEIKNYDKSQPNEKMDGDLSWLDNYKNASKDFTTQEKKSTEKPEENTKSEGIPEFFLDREKESEEKK